MSLEIIGNEILPNLYVKDIVLSMNSLSITVAAFDYVDEESKITWMTSDFVNKPNIHLNLIVTSDGSTVDAALKTNSNYNLFEQRVVLPAGGLPNTNQIADYKELLDFKDIIISKLEAATPESYIEINHTFSMAIKNFTEYEDLRCYAFFSYDPWWNPDRDYIDASGQNKKLLNGPIFSESIISNGSVVETTQRFTIDGVAYSGPVHFHNGRYMEGSLHKDTPHREVVNTEVPNTKISVKNYHSFFTAKPMTSPSTTSFFDMTKIAVGNRKIYGFFRFKTEEYFATKQDYKYFVNSYATLNLLKIKDQISMKINEENVDIKEILINHQDTNDLYFYFEKDFTEYVATTIEIEYQLLDQNSFFKNTLQSIVNEMESYRSPITVLLGSANGDYIHITNRQHIMGFIKGYCTLFSMFMEIPQSELVNLKTAIISFLYKNSIPKDVLKNYYNKYSGWLNGLKQRISSLNNQSTSVHTEERTRVIQLQNYESNLSYFGNRRIIDPGDILDSLNKTNSNLTGTTGVLPSYEQLFLPRFIRKTNNLLGILHEIDYNDLLNNASYLKMLQPGEAEEDEDIEEAEILGPNNNLADQEPNPSESLQDPQIEQPAQEMEPF